MLWIFTWFWELKVPKISENCMLLPKYWSFFAILVKITILPFFSPINNFKNKFASKPWLRTFLTFIHQILSTICSQNRVKIHHIYILIKSLLGASPYLTKQKNNFNGMIQISWFILFEQFLLLNLHNCSTFPVSFVYVMFRYLLYFSHLLMTLRFSTSFSFFTYSKYSKTCTQRPPLGLQICGRCWQVVVVQRWSLSQVCLYTYVKRH